jgi:hypothetical protein
VKRFARALWTVVLRPMAAVLALALVLAALIEGQPLEQFLYAIF